MCNEDVGDSLFISIFSINAIKPQRRNEWCVVMNVFPLVVTKS
jgi:hypothetical protein